MVTVISYMVNVILLALMIVIVMVTVIGIIVAIEILPATLILMVRSPLSLSSQPVFIFGFVSERTLSADC